MQILDFIAKWILHKHNIWRVWHSLWRQHRIMGWEFSWLPQNGKFLWQWDCHSSLSVNKSKPLENQVQFIEPTINNAIKETKYFILTIYSTLNTSTLNLPHRFTSDHTTNSNGFKLSYQAVEEGGTYLLGACGGNFTTPHGLLTSYLYPTDYPKDVTCTYVVTLPIGSFISLTILQLEVDCSSTHTDDLEMRDGDSEDSPLMVKFCNRDSNVPTEMSTSQNSFWMRYYSMMNCLKL